ncbi:hypothetical protein KSS87_001489 [Heliosperma pusillum]|nr:hypothetical protein KSS87_001489 [Heliosperma pusillum]
MPVCWLRMNSMAVLGQDIRNYQLSSVPLWRVSKYKALSFSSRPNTSTALRGSTMRCSCSGLMIDFESAAPYDWVPVIDQVLLTASVFLTYMAGVLPSEKSYLNSQKKNSSAVLLRESPVFFGRYQFVLSLIISFILSGTIEEDKASCQCNWSVIKGKITDSLLASENGVITTFDESDFNRTKRPLSLYAVEPGSRLRLLLSSVEQLEKEVNEIPDISEAMESGQWMGLFSLALIRTCRAAFSSWMDNEFHTKNCSPDKELLFYMSEKLKGDDMILGNIRKSGKMELYAGLISFFRYGSCRDSSYYDHGVYSLHGSAILEDLIITIADAIASTYLEVISVDSDVSEKISNLGLSLCALSTRALQKLRNEVAMCEWMHRNFGEIVLMYEDRFDMRVLKPEPYHESSDKNKESLRWWSTLFLRNSAKTESSMRYAVISPFSLSLKRTRELRALKGWRYYFSLVLELTDIALPVAKAIVAQARNAVSFFLVSLLGRSVGLVYTGIRQSLKWK